MSQLGKYLKQLRDQKDRSRRWAERQSKILYPDDERRWISHAYLRRIEEGLSGKPNPLKLQTLAELYGVDYRRVLAAAGYLDAEIPVAETEIGERLAEREFRSKLELAEKMIHLLESKGIHSAYFMSSVIELSDESLHLLNRLLTTLSLQERQLKKQQVDRAIP